MKVKKTLALVVSTLLLAASVFSLTACDASGQNAATANAEGADTISGLYTHFLSGEDMRDRLVASWSAVTHLDTLAQYNTLVLTEANTTFDNDRYELTKDLFNGEMDIHIEARFYGEFTYDGDEVTLHIPEYYTWIYYRNGRVMGDAYVYEPVVVDSTLSDGASFYGDYLDYHGYNRVEEMTVTVNRSEKTFEFNLDEDDDAAELGLESEDDGFNAGPIFGVYDDDEFDNDTPSESADEEGTEDGEDEDADAIGEDAVPGDEDEGSEEDEGGEDTGEEGADSSETSTANAG